MHRDNMNSTPSVVRDGSAALAALPLQALDQANLARLYALYKA